MTMFAMFVWLASLVCTAVFAFRKDWRNVRLFAGASVILSILIVLMPK